MTRLLLFSIYVSVTIICVGVSIWSSWKGFTAYLGGLALPVSVAIGLMLLAGDMALQQNRDRGRPILPVLVFMLLPFLASFASNFTYFYTNAMRERVAADKLVEAHELYDEMLQRAELVLRTTQTNVSGVELGRRLSEAMRALRDQIADPLNRGLGPEARAHVEEVYALLPNLTRLALPSDPQNTTQVDGYVSNLQRIVDRELAEATVGTSVQQAIVAVGEARTTGRGIFEEARLQPPEAWELKVSAVGDLAQEFRDVMPQVNTALEEAGAATLNTMSPIEESDVLLGEIPYSFRNGFIERPDVGATVVSSLSASGIDIMPILFALALFQRRREEYDI
jgi:hypothetical protein